MQRILDRLKASTDEKKPLNRQTDLSIVEAGLQMQDPAASTSRDVLPTYEIQGKGKEPAEEPIASISSGASQAISQPSKGKEPAEESELAKLGNLDKLPVEILLHCIKYLNLRDFTVLRGVCQSLKGLVTNELFILNFKEPKLQYLSENMIDVSALERRYSKLTIEYSKHVKKISGYVEYLRNHKQKDKSLLKKIVSSLTVISSSAYGVGMLLNNLRSHQLNEFVNTVQEQINQLTPQVNQAFETYCSSLDSFSNTTNCVSDCRPDPAGPLGCFSSGGYALPPSCMGEISNLCNSILNNVGSAYRNYYQLYQQCNNLEFGPTSSQIDKSSFSIYNNNFILSVSFVTALLMIACIAWILYETSKNFTETRRVGCFNRQIRREILNLGEGPEGRTGIVLSNTSFVLHQLESILTYLEGVRSNFNQQRIALNYLKHGLFSVNIHNIEADALRDYTRTRYVPPYEGIGAHEDLSPLGYGGNRVL